MEKNSKKGSSFFIKKSDINTNNPSQFSNKTTTSSGNFFVSPFEKQKILEEKSRRNALRQKKKGETDDTPRQPKKTFDKKKWRLQRYSKKYKLEQWEEKRRKVVLNEYYRQVKDDDTPKFDVRKIYENDDVDTTSQLGKKDEENENENNLNNDIGMGDSEMGDAQTVKKGKRKPFRMPHLEFQRLQEEKEKKKEERMKNKTEKMELLKQKKQKKIDTYRKLNKKTKRGQPIMKHRMEMLLEQIQKTI